MFGSEDVCMDRNESIHHEGWIDGEEYVASQRRIHDCCGYVGCTLRGHVSRLYYILYYLQSVV
jgi:hypothetical protein